MSGKLCLVQTLDITIIMYICIIIYNLVNVLAYCIEFMNSGYQIGPQVLGMEENNVATVSETWVLEPTTEKQLQWFLVFANFYFIWWYSSVSALLTDLNRKPKSITFKPEAKATFERINQLYTTAPFLNLPHPSKEFVGWLYRFRFDCGVVTEI